MALLSALVVLQAQSANSNLPAEFNTPRQIMTVAPNGSQKSIRIVSWNIDRGEQLNVVASELARDPADLCMLQEVDWNTNRSGQADIAAELANRLHLNLSYAIEFEELSQEHGREAFIGQATLTRLPIRQSRVLRFHRQSSWWQPHSWIPSSVPLMQRRLGSRIALVNELEFAGRPLIVYNVHLESRSFGSIQSEQLDEILRDLKKYPPNTAAIIGGDFNSKYFPSAFLKKFEREGFQSALGQHIERTHAIAMALDWIFARGVKLENGKVRKDLKGSDHYPIYARLAAE